MEASEKFQEFTLFIRRLLRIIGCDVLDGSWKMNFATYFALFLCTGYTIGTVTAIVVAPDFFELLKALSFIGFFFQSTIKLYYSLTDRKAYHKNYSSLGRDIYEKHLDGTASQRKVILQNIDIVLVLKNVTALLYFATLIIFSFYPAYMYFVMHVKVTMLPILFPGLDIYSMYGYGVTTALHVIIAIYGLMGALVSDIAFMQFVLHFKSFAELFQIMCEEFGQQLHEKTIDDEPRRRRKYAKFCRHGMRDIYRYHQNTIVYLKSLIMCYGTICVVMVMTCSYSIMLNLFLALMTDWYATYSFLLVSLFQLLIFCMFGAVVQVTNGRLNRTITSLPWYLLPTREQRLYQLMLFKSQLPDEIFILGVGPLNMETFTLIMKKIYSAFAMMYSFLVEDAAGEGGGALNNHDSNNGHHDNGGAYAGAGAGS
ncbi:odorant receptor 67d [Anopheles darlingi]|uniref:odorant receptor 67d n=1 Tax=Anopheles darlingi TaxID=43151 RepID=UPI0021000A03|nr:odorant receptor 67d [Anopheles darlingi]